MVISYFICGGSLKTKSSSYNASETYPQKTYVHRVTIYSNKTCNNNEKKSTKRKGGIMQ